MLAFSFSINLLEKYIIRYSNVRNVLKINQFPNIERRYSGHMSRDAHMDNIHGCPRG